MKKCEYIEKKASSLESSYFKANKLSILNRPNDSNMAIMVAGPRAGGMNVALHVTVRYALSLNQNLFVVENGFDGLFAGNLINPKPYSFEQSFYSGSTLLNAGYNKISDPSQILKKLQEHKITSLIVIGGLQALKIISDLEKYMRSTNKLYTNIILIPAAIENNIPFTDNSLGADTALNCLTLGCDSLRKSSLTLPNTAFVAEINGNNSGYLTLFAGIAANAFEVFLPEHKYNTKHLSETSLRIKQAFKKNKNHGIILIKDENALKNISIDAFSQLLSTDANNSFDVKYCVFGELIHGGSTSPFDRIYASVMAIKAVDILTKAKDERELLDQEYIIGMLIKRGSTLGLSSIPQAQEIHEKIDNREITPDWLQYANICKSLE